MTDDKCPACGADRNWNELATIYVCGSELRLTSLYESQNCVSRQLDKANARIEELERQLAEERATHVFDDGCVGWKIVSFKPPDSWLLESPIGARRRVWTNAEEKR